MTKLKNQPPQNKDTSEESEELCPKLDDMLSKLESTFTKVHDSAVTSNVGGSITVDKLFAAIVEFSRRQIERQGKLMACTYIVVDKEGHTNVALVPCTHPILDAVDEARYVNSIRDAIKYISKDMKVLGVMTVTEALAVLTAPGNPEGLTMDDIEGRKDAKDCIVFQAEIPGQKARTVMYKIYKSPDGNSCQMEKKPSLDSHIDQVEVATRFRDLL